MCTHVQWVELFIPRLDIAPQLRDEFDEGFLLCLDGFYALREAHHDRAGSS